MTHGLAATYKHGCRCDACRASHRTYQVAKRQERLGRADTPHGLSTPVVIVPSGCRHCGIPERTHFQRHTTAAGWHVWMAPTAEQIKARMLARRTPAVLHPTQEPR